MTPNRDANNQAALVPVDLLQSILRQAPSYGPLWHGSEEMKRLREAVASPTSPHEAETPAAADVLAEFDKTLTRVWGKEQDPYGYAYGWVRQKWQAALASHRATPVEAETPSMEADYWADGEQAFRANIVALWPAHNRARFNIPLYRATPADTPSRVPAEPREGEKP